MILACFLSAQAASLTAQLDRQVVPLDETVTLKLTFEGVAPQSTPNLPALPGLNVLGTSQSSQFTIVNGLQSSKITFNYTLMPTQPGEVVIPAMQVQVSGQTLTSQPLRLKVTPSANNAGSKAQTNLAFLKLVVPRSEVFLGEPFVVEMQLYFREAQDIRMPQLSAEGFALGQSAQPAQTTTTVDGIGYNVVIFKTSITAAKAGTVALGPATCDLNLRIPLAGSRQRDPFDPFSFFGPRVQLRPTTLNSGTVSLRVSPLPSENVPPTFNGAVGQFQLHVTAGPTNLAVGDPITIRARISGRGSLDRLTLPEQADWHDFKTYPATSSVETANPMGLDGAKVFEQVVIPQNHEIKALPAFQFSFFDPNQKNYRTLTKPAIPLTIRPGNASPVPILSLTNAVTASPPPVADDIVHIKPRLGSNEGTTLLIQQPWFLSLHAIPVLAWLALLAHRKRKESLANNPKLRRQRAVAQRVKLGLDELRTHAESQNSDEFFALLFRLIQEQLGAQLDLAAPSITEAIIDERLHAVRLPEGTLHALRDLFLACNQARYAPVRSRQELSALIPKAKAVLCDLESLKA
jgi:hypothetical protein